MLRRTNTKPLRVDRQSNAWDKMIWKLSSQNRLTASEIRQAFPSLTPCQIARRIHGTREFRKDRAQYVLTRAKAQLDRCQRLLDEIRKLRR